MAFLAISLAMLGYLVTVGAFLAIPLDISGFLATLFQRLLTYELPSGGPCGRLPSTRPGGMREAINKS